MSIINSFAPKKLVIHAFNEINSLDNALFNDNYISVNSYYHFHIEKCIKSTLEKLEKDYTGVMPKSVLTKHIQDDLEEIVKMNKNPRMQIITKDLCITNMYQCTTKKITKEYYEKYYNIILKDDIIDYQGCSLEKLINDVKTQKTKMYNT